MATPPDIEFGELPPSSGRGSGGPWIADAVATLKERPGEWAKVRSGVPTGTAGPSAGRLKDKGCEVTTRKIGDNAIDIWARWPEAL